MGEETLDLLPVRVMAAYDRGEISKDLAADIMAGLKDAERYRWLRGNFEHMYTAEGPLEATSGEWNSDADGRLLDAHCDSAIASAKGEKAGTHNQESVR